MLSESLVLCLSVLRLLVFSGWVESDMHSSLADVLPTGQFMRFPLVVATLPGVSDAEMEAVMVSFLPSGSIPASRTSAS